MGTIQKITLRFVDGHVINYDFKFSARGTIQHSSLRQLLEMEWVELDYHKCTHCSLESGPYATCPVATTLAQYTVELADFDSFEKVEVEVDESDGRVVTFVDMPLQEVVGELVRLAVFQSACPIGSTMKPIMKLIRPFPTHDEMLQSIATFFTIHGLSEDDELTEVQQQLLEKLRDLFQHLVERLKSYGSGDAHLNGVVVMDTLSLMFDLSGSDLIKKTINEFRSWK